MEVVWKSLWISFLIRVVTFSAVIIGKKYRLIITKSFLGLRRRKYLLKTFHELLIIKLLLANFLYVRDFLTFLAS